MPELRAWMQCLLPWSAPLLLELVFWAAAGEANASDGGTSMAHDCPSAMSPGARNSRIFALRTGFPRHPAPVYQWHLSCQKLQLLEAEERERAFTGRGRWNQVRSLAEAKTIMIFLFNLASSTRCSLCDKEVSCREKDSEVRDLKEKVVHLVQQLELQKAEY
ncbi:hypothetical protein POM88_054818 [Heracleum sosnowskyi]|uniref:Uncharacterized protein n=1 Tax=Heracleum sosnowskyi TaxID=360622 RepID=A0AAD8LW83_9APIA|nr:hypothetical protein POM88_054818 [Heracleum sosnowskyi]